MKSLTTRTTLLPGETQADRQDSLTVLMRTMLPRLSAENRLRMQLRPNAPQNKSRKTWRSWSSCESGGTLVRGWPF